MNKEIKKYIREIIFITIFLIAAIPVYLNNNINGEKDKLANMNSLSLTKNNSTLYSISDEDGLYKMKEEQINIKNDYLPTNYELYLIYNKESSTNLDNLKIKLDNSIHNLKDLYVSEDTKYIYFLLDNNYIEKYKECLFNIWLEDSNNTNSQINYSLIVKKI